MGPLVAAAAAICAAAPSTTALVVTAVAGYLLLILAEIFFIKDRLRYRHIPGPKPFPIAGNLMEIRDRFSRRANHAFEAWRKQHGTVFKYFMGSTVAVVSSDPEILHQVTTKHFRDFHDRTLFRAPGPHGLIATSSSTLTFAKGAVWRDLKGGMQPLVRKQGLEAACKHTEEAVQAARPILVAAARSGKPLDGQKLMSAITLRILGHAAFGLELDALSEDPKVRERAETIVEAAHDGITAYTENMWSAVIPRAVAPISDLLLKALPPASLRRLRRANARVHAAAAALAANAMQRRGLVWDDRVGLSKALANEDTADVAEMFRDMVPGEDSALDMLVAGRARGQFAKLQPHNIVAQSSGLLVAGQDTTGFCLTNALFFLATNPEAQARVIAEVDALGPGAAIGLEQLPSLPYLEAVIKETLRLMPSVWVTNRVASKDITVAGLYIPKGTDMYLDLLGMQRDPKLWPEPLAFRPERFLEGAPPLAHPLAWSPFGAGPRACHGAKLAMQEVRQILARLHQEFVFELDVSTRLEPDGLPPICASLHAAFVEPVKFHVHTRRQPRAA